MRNSKVDDFIHFMIILKSTRGPVLGFNAYKRVTQSILVVSSGRQK